jgi:hypothetical protein
VTAPQNPIVDGLQRVLAAQHACVFGYPELGTHLDDDGQVTRARANEAAHRLTRDAVAAQLVALGATPAASAPGYAPPAPVTSAATARRWAVALEEQSAAAYRYLLVCSAQAGSNLSIRPQAMTGLTTAAQDATYWRRLVTPDRPTVAFPGAQ